MLREFLREKMRLAWLQTSLSPWEFIDEGLEEGISSRHVAQWRVRPANMQLHLDGGLLPGCHDRLSGRERDPAPITLELLPHAALHPFQGTAGSVCLQTPMRAHVPGPRRWSAGRRGNVTAAEGSDTSTSPPGRWTRFGSEGLGGLRSEVSVQYPTHRRARHFPTLLPSAEQGPAAYSRQESRAGQAAFSCRSSSPPPQQVVSTRACYTFILRCYLFV